MILYGILTLMAIAGSGLLALLSPSIDTMVDWFPDFTAAVANAASYVAITADIVPWTTLFTVLGVALLFEIGVAAYGFTLYLLKKFRILG